MKNKERKLTEAEEKRLVLFNKNSKDLKAKGYSEVDLTSDLIKPNIIGPLLGLLLSLPFIICFYIFNKNSFEIGENYFRNNTIFIVLLFIFIFIHELIHGLTWSLFTENKFKDIEFGFILKSLNPYCTCKTPLKENEYITGLIMPCVVLGIIPCIISLINKNTWYLYMGVVMILSAGGDLFILKMILENRNNKKSLYLDHPTDIGVVKFEKELS